MTDMELLDILGKYILEAQQMREGRRKTPRFRYVRQLAAVIALILILAIFLNTAPGAAAVEYVKEKVASLIEILFPPKKMAMEIEGMPYAGDYAADGVEPQATAETPQPGFAIYYDVDNYTELQLKSLEKILIARRARSSYETCFVISFLINHKTGSAVRRCLPD